MQACENDKIDSGPSLRSIMLCHDMRAASIHQLQIAVTGDTPWMLQLKLLLPHSEEIADHAHLD